MLTPPQHIAVLGVSPKPHRASFRVTEFLIDQGFHVTLVNPLKAGTSLFERPVYESLASATHAEGRFDWVDVFRAAEHLPTILDDVLACRAGGLWGQLDVMDEAVAQRAYRAGLNVVMDRCPAIEMPRLGML